MEESVTQQIQNPRKVTIKIHVKNCIISKYNKHVVAAIERNYHVLYSIYSNEINILTEFKC